MKRLLSLSLCLLLALPLCACSGKTDEVRLTVTFLSVGKADCILLESGGHAALIDTGNNKNGKDILALLSEKGITRLDFLLLTHMDKDHIGGADTVLSGIPIGTVYAPDYEKDSKQYRQYSSAMEQAGLTAVSPDEPLTLLLGEEELTLYPPQQAEYEDSNNYSILSRLTCGEISFLFAGDAEDARLEEYLSATPAPSTVLKVPHHGQSSALSEAFFKTVSPKIAVITDSAEEPADDAVISLLKGLGTKVYETADGTIVMETDGKQIWVR